MGGRCGRRGTINGGLSFIIQFVDRTVGGLPLHNAVNETLADRLIADLSSLPRSFSDLWPMWRFAGLFKDE